MNNVAIRDDLATLLSTYISDEVSDEAYIRQMDLAMKKINQTKLTSVFPQDVQRQLQAIQDKLEFHGLNKNAQALSLCTVKLLSLCDSPSTWSALQLLVSLAENPIEVDLEKVKLKMKNYRLIEDNDIAKRESQALRFAEEQNEKLALEELRMLQLEADDKCMEITPSLSSDTFLETPLSLSSLSPCTSSSSSFSASISICSKDEEPESPSLSPTASPLRIQIENKLKELVYCDQFYSLDSPSPTLHQQIERALPASKHQASLPISPSLLQSSYQFVSRERIHSFSQKTQVLEEWIVSQVLLSLLGLHSAFFHRCSSPKGPQFPPYLQLISHTLQNYRVPDLSASALYNAMSFWQAKVESFDEMRQLLLVCQKSNTLLFNTLSPLRRLFCEMEQVFRRLGSFLSQYISLPVSCQLSMDIDGSDKLIRNPCQVSRLEKFDAFYDFKKLSNMRRELGPAAKKKEKTRIRKKDKLEEDNDKMVTSKVESMFPNLNGMMNAASGEKTLPVLTLLQMQQQWRKIEVVFSLAKQLFHCVFFSDEKSLSPYRMSCDSSLTCLPFSFAQEKEAIERAVAFLHCAENSFTFFNSRNVLDSFFSPSFPQESKCPLPKRAHDMLLDDEDRHMFDTFRSQALAPEYIKASLRCLLNPIHPLCSSLLPHPTLGFSSRFSHPLNLSGQSHSVVELNFLVKTLISLFIRLSLQQRTHFEAHCSHELNAPLAALWEKLLYSSFAQESARKFHSCNLGVQQLRNKIISSSFPIEFALGDSKDSFAEFLDHWSHSIRIAENQAHSLLIETMTDSRKLDVDKGQWEWKGHHEMKAVWSSDKGDVGEFYQLYCLPLIDATIQKIKKEERESLYEDEKLHTIFKSLRSVKFAYDLYRNLNRQTCWTFLNMEFYLIKESPPADFNDSQRLGYKILSLLSSPFISNYHGSSVDIPLSESSLPFIQECSLDTTALELNDVITNKNLIWMSKFLPDYVRHTHRQVRNILLSLLATNDMLLHLQTQSRNKIFQSYHKTRKQLNNNLLDQSFSFPSSTPSLSSSSFIQTISYLRNLTKGENHARALFDNFFLSDHAPPPEVTHARKVAQEQATKFLYTSLDIFLMLRSFANDAIRQGSPFTVSAYATEKVADCRSLLDIIFVGDVNEEDISNYITDLIRSVEDLGYGWSKKSILNELRRKRMDPQEDLIHASEKYHCQAIRKFFMRFLMLHWLYVYEVYALDLEMYKDDGLGNLIDITKLEGVYQRFTSRIYGLSCLKEKVASRISWHAKCVGEINGPRSKELYEGCVGQKCETVINTFTHLSNIFSRHELILL